LESFLRQLKRTPLGEMIRHHNILPGRPAEWGSLSRPLPEGIARFLAAKGISRLYSHQAEALEKIQGGRPVILSTPTASGKSLVYILAALLRLEEDPQARSLFLYPIKALEQDQKKILEDWAPLFPVSGKAPCAVYDGDTPVSERKKIRLDPPPILISNPDMVHLGLLPFHETWRTFFEHLRLVVIDEAHVYKGILGSHMVQVIRRLRRICRCYGSEPQFVLCSATISQPERFSESLTGLSFQVVDRSGFPAPAKHFLFLNPDISAAVVGARLFVYCLSQGKKTIVFTQGRRVTELIHMWAERMAPALKGRISSYRAGFLPEERRVIESRLASGELLGVVSTSALEMGIDIGSLDVCILVGYPGSVINTWQRGGRVGRSQRESAILLIAQPDALDQYFMRHPEDFFERRFETAVLDPENGPILKAHLTCAAAEGPITLNDPFFPPSRYDRQLQELEKEGHLFRTADGEAWISAKRLPQREVNLRSVGEAFSILNGRKGEVVGTLDRLRAFRECHPGAIYLHRAESYVVDELDLKEKNVYVRRKEVDYYTRIMARKETEILEREQVRPVGNFLVHFGRIRVTETFTGYEKRAIHGQELLGTYPLDLPPQTFETEGLWVEIEEVIQDQLKAEGLQVMGSLHALEHGAIGIFPLYALCDRGDIGGICYPHHPQLGKGAIFIYDGYPGGVGLAGRGYEIIEDLLKKTLDLIAECPCENGCPSCIHSPQCGSGNKPLDKAGAIRLIQLLLGMAPIQKVKTAEEEGWAPPPRTGPRLSAALPRLGFFDLETQRLAEEVGGWGNKHLLRLSVGVIFDSADGGYHTYQESQVKDLIEHLKRLDVVVGFNVKHFDYAVLSGYSAFDFGRLSTLDLLEDIAAVLGFRLSLDHLGRTTLGKQKTADGIQAVQWFRMGAWERLVEYCREDVALTKALFEYGGRNGHILFESKTGQKVRCPVDWGEERIRTLAAKP